MKATLDDAPFGQHDECSGLFVRALNGDSDAATRLYQQCAPDLRRWLAGRLPGCDAEELAHAAIVTAFRRSARFRRGTSFQAWLKAIAWHLALNGQRDDMRRRVRENAWFEHERTQRTSDGVDDRARLRLLSNCLDALPEPQRRLLQLRYTEGKSAEIIALEQGRKRSAVAVSLHRICRRLRDEIAQTATSQIGSGFITKR